MRSPSRKHLAISCLALAGAALAGCSGTGGGRPRTTSGTGGLDESAGTGGRIEPAGGTGGRATGGSGDGSGGDAGASLPDSGADTDSSVPTSGGPDGATGPADGPAPGGWAGVPGIEDLSTVKKSPGCGKPAPDGLSANSYASRMITIPMPVRGSGNRRYTIKLPPNYKQDTPYRLIIFAPGCNGTAPPFGDFTQLAGNESVVQAVLQIELGIGTYPQCFDDKRTDSAEYAYFERVLTEIKSQLCIDEHRVFVGGHSSGAWLTNQLGCVYGSTLIRAIFPASGGLAVSPRDDVMGVRSAPPCKDTPTPGIWVHNQDDTINRPEGSRSAIERALRVNKCTNTGFTGPREPYMAPGSGMDCERFTTCPKEFPIVYCHPPTGGHPPPGFAPAAMWQFLKQLP